MSDINQTKNYYGTCEKNFKEYYNKHTASFRNKNKEKSTELSKYIWEKNSSINYDLKCSLMLAKSTNTQVVLENVVYV